MGATASCATSPDELFVGNGRSGRYQSHPERPFQKIPVRPGSW